MVSGKLTTETVKPSRRLWLASLVLAALGLVDALYLSWIKLTHNEASCIKGVGDCYSVNTSRYSEFAGIPVAVLGAGAYVVIILLLLWESREGFWQDNAIILSLGVTLFGVLYSAYLTYLEIAVIRAICPFCVVSALIMLTLLILTTIRLIQSQRSQTI